MVKINYCPKCGRATREHLFPRVRCRICNTAFENIDVSRSHYFVVQFIFLTLGFVILAAAFVVTNPLVREFEFLGVAFLGISMWIFALMFQLLDSKDMEFRAQQQGQSQTLGLELPSSYPEARKSAGSRPRWTAPAAQAVPPKVVRIKRAVPRTGAMREPELRPERTRSAPKPPPIVIRDMSGIFSDDDGAVDAKKRRRKNVG